MTTDRHERRAHNARRLFALLGLVLVALILGSGGAGADEKEDIKKAKEEIERLKQEKDQLADERARAGRSCRRDNS